MEIVGKVFKNSLHHHHQLVYGLAQCKRQDGVASSLLKQVASRSFCIRRWWRKQEAWLMLWGLLEPGATHGYPLNLRASFMLQQGHKGRVTPLGKQTFLPRICKRRWPFPKSTLCNGQGWSAPDLNLDLLLASEVARQSDANFLGAFNKKSVYFPQGLRAKSQFASYESMRFWRFPNGNLEWEAQDGLHPKKRTFLLSQKVWFIQPLADFFHWFCSTLLAA